jgi:circadian clock protein KaiC
MSKKNASVSSTNKNSSFSSLKASLQRAPTGIAKFDSICEGGFVKGSINLMIGDSGTGKTTFGMQFLINGIERYNENGIYLCFEEKKDEVFRRMSRFGWDFVKYEKENRFAYMEYTAEEIEKILESGGGTISDIIANTKAKRIVIDSITAFTLLFDSNITKRESLISLSKMLRKWGLTAVLISNESQNLNEHKAIVEEFESDCEIITYTMFEGKARHKYLEVFKMRGTEHSNKLHEFDILTNKGFVFKR